MIYCPLNKLDKASSTQLAVCDLFPKNPPSYNFDEAVQNKIDVPSSKVSIPGSLCYLAQDEWVSIDSLHDVQGVCIDGLESCAAVLIYSGNHRDGYRLVKAGHAGGGNIDPQYLTGIEPDADYWAIYATPTLGDKSSTSYRVPINLLALYCGPTNVCFIDEFKIVGCVMANFGGGFICAGK